MLKSYNERQQPKPRLITLKCLKHVIFSLIGITEATLFSKNASPLRGQVEASLEFVDNTKKKSALFEFL